MPSGKKRRLYGDWGRGVQFEIGGVRAIAFASKPAPTFNRILLKELVRMWERACSRRGQPGH
ncbi:hypothetical protein EAH78_03810 [Pseudomonas arsenicoxydans]|uniref:Uncharacterized protein n=1 Tax=Pseudomonas arsenicoxydans TaxID=702115 RepID=A0A502I4P1_9PSED|nr:hypothetical protein EAH78_03810 [Pseudomonas arsenicoxydans]